MEYLFRTNIENVNPFFFSTNHLVVLFIVAIFLYVSPKLIKNILPYTYLIEKVICALLLGEFLFTQLFFISSGQYNTALYLPITISRIASYICILILFFKKYHLFNVFFSWATVSSIGGLIFFQYIPYSFPHIVYFAYIFYHLVLLYSVLYLVEVRKFKITKSAIIENILFSIIYFISIFILNILCHTKYGYINNFNSIIGLFIHMITFILLTSLIYIPFIIKDDFSFNFKHKKRKK